VLTTAPSALADSTIKDPNPPKYAVELEPKFNLTPSGFFDYGGTGFGPGLRVSIPVMSPGFIKTINDSIAISFGLDLMRYDGYRYFKGGCGKNLNCGYYDAGGFWAMYLPVAMQWNFWLTDRWSVFAEPGFAFRHAFFDDAYCDPRLYGCGTSRNDFYFAFYGGARFALSDRLALTMRLGHPTLLSVGLSIFF
jgi:hypothetical protein